MTTGRPARALGQEVRVISIADKDSAGLGLLLKVALQTKSVVALGQHALVDRAVRRMTGRATFTQCLMLVNKRASLCGVTLKTCFVLTEKSNAATLEGLMNIRPASFHRLSLVGIVAIGAAHFAFEHGMAMR